MAWSRKDSEHNSVIKMKSAYSSTWKSSVQPRKQRKYAYNAPYHIASRMIASHLSPELRKKHGRRNIRLRTGDKVKVMRGQFKGQTSKVERIDGTRKKVYLSKIEIVRKDGTKRLFPFTASNLMVTELNTDDKKRLKGGDQKNG